MYVYVMIEAIIENYCHKNFIYTISFSTLLFYIRVYIYIYIYIFFFPSDLTSCY